mmetsp:Transcript_7640/g.4097  ORF Transcript_7640/g.4097 Transcript_7640/m.4097 type:complete len:112 (-) Transcript_7640:22-357(-)
MSFCFHPGTKGDYYWSMQMLVSFSMFIEALGLLPQLFLMRKSGEVEGMTSHYMMCLGLSRLIRLFFWLALWMEGDLFVYLVLADLMHTFLLADFAYYYFCAIRSGTPLLVK